MTESIRSSGRVALALALALLAAWGASDAEPSPATPRQSGAEENLDEGHDRAATVAAEDRAPDGPPPELAPPAEPEPVVVEAGRRLGPVTIGMTEDALRGLGLEETEVDPRSRRFGPYRVFLEEGTVRRVEASMGALERIRVGERTFASGVHIHALRDAFGDCQWVEGGGERYRCADGALSVQTDHSMDPARYVVGVEGR